MHQQRRDSEGLLRLRRELAGKCEVVEDDGMLDGAILTEADESLTDDMLRCSSVVIELGQ